MSHGGESPVVCASEGGKASDKWGSRSTHLSFDSVRGKGCKSFFPRFPPPPATPKRLRQGAKKILTDYNGWHCVPGTFSQTGQAQVPSVMVTEPGTSFVNAVGLSQLMVQTQVCHKKIKKFLRVLVDTGAQPNLVRPGIFPRDLFRPANHPLSLQGANQKSIEGGTHVIPLTLKFRKGQDGPVYTFHGTFYEADIAADIILSNSWMAQKGIAPFPEFNQIAVREGDFLVMLHPMGSPGPPLQKPHELRLHHLPSLHQLRILSALSQEKREEKNGFESLFPPWLMMLKMMHCSWHGCYLRTPSPPPGGW